MLEENQIVDQAQQVMEKLCTIAKTNCEKHFITDQEKKRKMYTQEELKEHIREKWTSELVTTTQIRKFLTAVNTVTEKVNAYKLEKTDDYDTLPVELQAQIKYLKVKLAYQIGRNRSKWGNPVEDFEKEAGLMSLIDGIKSSTKEYEKQKKEHYLSLFEEIKDGAQSCNNISSLRSFADKAGALKIRLMDEMDNMDRQIAERKQAEEIRRIEEEAKKRGSAVSDVEVARSIAEQKKQYKVRKTKNVPIKKITGTSSWRLENKDDIDKYVEELRMRLLSQMDEDTIVNIEF